MKTRSGNLLLLFSIGLSLAGSTRAEDVTISSASELKAFATRVNSGETSLDATLAADIDYTDFVQIGGNYSGTFDGRGHTVTIAVESTKQGAALFFNNRGTVQNLRVAGTITTSSNNPGGICYYNYGTIRNCVAEVDFTFTGAGVSVTAGGISGQATSGSTIENCMFNGSFTKGEGANENTKNVGGLVGWMDGSPSVRNCLVIAGSDLGGDFKPVGRGYNRATNTYYMQKAGSTASIQTSTGATAVTAAQLASGEVAYLTGATQDIGSETQPNFLGTSSMVYAIGSEGNRCDLAPLGDIASYSNTRPAVSAHSYADGICSNCGTFQEGFVPLEDGCYIISNVSQLVWFAKKVMKGDAGRDGKLASDIDLSGTGWIPIGTQSVPYRGIFDGQGHAITGFSLVYEGGRQGLFGQTNGATIRNFSIDGTITANGDGGGDAGLGVIGWAEASTIQNVHSSLVVNATGSGLGSTHVGGTVERCSFSGQMNGGTGMINCFGCVVGYMKDRSVIRNCANYGTLTYSGSEGSAGGILGYTWASNGGKIENCLNIGDVDVDKSGGGGIVGLLRAYSTSIVSNNYMLDGSASQPYGSKDDSAGTCTVVTGEQLSGGEVAYRLNGSIGGGENWYQTLGTDAYPLPYGTDKVYAIGTEGNRCDLAPLGDIASYSNTRPAIPEHNYVDGICTRCGLVEEGYMQMADGWYQIETEGQLVWFANQVAKGNPGINGKLMNDIELTYEWMTPIGSDEVPYAGIFDGQNHAITGFSLTYESGKQGLFGVITGATVRNFSIEGTVIALGNGKGDSDLGVIAWSTYSTIQNVHSAVVFDATSTTAYSLGSTHVGGLVGSLRTGSSMERCSFSGVMSNGINRIDCFACLVGYINDNAKITNCANYGTLSSTAVEGNAGGIVAWMNTPQAKVTNCLNAGRINFDVTDNGGAIVGWQNDWGYSSNKDGVTGCYWLEGTAKYATGKNDNGKNPCVTAEQLASGAVAWQMNGESFVDPVWYQDLSNDRFPMLYGETIVYKTADGYDNVTPSDESSLAGFIEDVTSLETLFAEETLANKELLDSYMTQVETWRDIASFEDFCKAYTEAMKTKEAVKASARAYAAYVKACQDAAAYMEENGLEGSKADLLRTYLEENEEPSEDYPNGTHYYIIEKHELTDNEIAAETEFVNKMLESAIAGGIAAGTEITRLLVNPAFTDGFEGWTAEYEGGTIATGGVKGLMPVARGLNNSALSISQTLTDLPAGIYMTAANGMFRSGNDVTTKFYAGQLYLNGTANYIMSPGEDIVSDDEAEDRVNCYIDEDTHYEDYNYDVYGYVPNTMAGASYAFSAGRYPNFCATEVTDGSLTIGVRNLGTGLANDFMPFGGLHVYYLGTADEAGDQLADVLQGFADRAQTIIDYEPNEENYTQRPNTSEELKAQLSTAIAEADAASTGARKMALIQKFSDLFAEVYACRKAYIEMYKASNETFDLIDALLGANIVTEDEYSDVMENIYAAQAHFAEGDVNAEEALDIAAELRGALSLPVKDGVYQLASVNDLKKFSIFTNVTTGSAKAVLAADINFEADEALDFTPIGTSKKPFAGEFDGQGHSITGFVMEGASGDGQGLFGFTNGATIQNFSISGSIDYYGGTGVGVVGWSQANTTIRNVHSLLNINIVEVSSHVGGVVGTMRAGTKLLGCSFSGNISDTAGSNDCIGGLAGYANEYSSFENCANYGTITFSSAECFAGGILGYLNNSSFAGMKNCLSVGTVQTAEGGASTYGGALAGRIRSYDPTAFLNNYWLEGCAEKVSGENAIKGEAVSAGQLASGEICYKLNPSDINWYQTLFTDETHTPDPYPVLFPSHEEVLYSETLGYYNANDPDGIGEIKDEQLKMNNEVFDLSGRKIANSNPSNSKSLNSKSLNSKLQRGLYIVGGKKILIK